MTVLQSVLRSLGFHVHDWTQWQDYGPLHAKSLWDDEDTPSRRVGLIQVCECSACKKKRFKNVRFG